MLQVLGWGVGAAVAEAHLLNMTRLHATIVAPRVLELQVDVDLTRLLGDADQYRALLQLPPADQPARLRELGRQVLAETGVAIDGMPCSLALDSWQLPDTPPEQIGDQAVAAMTVFRYAQALPDAAQELTVVPAMLARIEFPLAYTFSIPATGVQFTRWLELPGAPSRVLRIPERVVPPAPSHRAPAVIAASAAPESPDRKAAPFDAPTNTRPAVAAEPIRAAPTADEFTAKELRIARVVSTVLEHFRLGFRHIFPDGIDHVLFVLGLFFLAPRWRPLLQQTTVFTIAHTTTLGLSAYGIVALPARVVEPLIALSIAYVAAENIWKPRLSTARLAIVFAFGLLHGLGFASSLSEVPMPRDQFFTALLAFNLGVDFGQLAVIAAAFLAVGWFRHRVWYTRAIVTPICAVIAAIGGYWTVARLFT